MDIDIVRDTAVSVLLRVFQHDAFLSIALDKALGRDKLSDRGRRFMTQLVYGTVRHKLLCDHVLTPLTRQPLNDLPAPILAILRMGVFQALFCRQVTFPAMVHTSVDLARRRGHAGTARLVNAVLRRVPESLDAVVFPDRAQKPAQYLSVRHSMPEWLVREWINEYGFERAESLCDALNAEAPASLRVNTLAVAPERLLESLRKKDFAAEHRTPIPEEITVLDGPPPAKSKLFQAGQYLMQDPASMLPPHLLKPQPGDRVLDLCAAPGAKTTHLSQLTDGRANITAMDIHAGKLGLVRENVQRLALPDINLVCGDGRFAPFRPVFDRVLVDAPCSGLGTLRRHPDLKWRVTPETRAALSSLQLDLLRSAIGVCKNDASIVYSVCTFTREETVDIARRILASGEVTTEDGVSWLDQWKINKGQYRILPEKEGLDGFFLMRLRKRS